MINNHLLYHIYFHLHHIGSDYMRCEWCQSLDYSVVPDQIYDHFICNNCHHEWDTVTTEKERLREYSQKSRQLIIEIAKRFRGEQK
jgi:hypothetical protein